MIWRGVAWALGAAVVHTAIDALRKSASASLSTQSLVSLVALLDAGISCLFVYLTGGFKRIEFQDEKLFTVAVVSSSLLLLFSKFLYQHALAVSQLSLTVPYLSFTPTFLIATAFFFLDEEPTPLGLLGVAIVTAGGYLLSRQDTSSSGNSSSSADKSILPVTKPASATSRSGNLKRTGSAAPSPLAAWFGLNGTQTPASKVHVEGAGAGSLESSAAQHVSQDTLSTRGSSQRLTEMVDAKSVVASSTNTVKVLAVRPGKTATALTIPESEPLMSDTGQLGFAGEKVAQGSGVAGAPTRTHATAAGSGRGGACQRLIDSGTGLMVLVAFMWSVTASLDKLGVLHAPNVWVYLAVQKSVIGLVSVVYLLWHSPGAFKLLFSRSVRLLFVISVCETLAVVFFLEAIRHLFVSYVVAIKRCNILMSVVLGGLLWKEKIIHRLPYICLMLSGMMLIVLDPDSSTVHTSSHS